MNVMKMTSKNLGLWLICICCVLVAYAARADDVKWVPYTDFSYISTSAVDQGKPILVFFRAGWSEPSQKMIEKTWTEDRIIFLSKNYICISVDIEEDPDLVTRFEVNTYPTIILADPWGDVTVKRTGYMPSRSLAVLMKSFPTDFSELSRLKTLVEEDHTNVKALKKIATFYGKMRAWDKSNHYLERALEVEAKGKESELLEEILQGIAINELRLRNFDKAQEAFEKALAEYPKSEFASKIMYGLFIAYIGLQKHDQAEKILKSLQEKYPDSPMTEQAEKILESLKKTKKDYTVITVRKKKK